MISLIMPPKSAIALTAKMLADEYGTASNIKSRVNRQSVLTAITSAQQKLKLYNRCPRNGLVIYCGEVMTDDGKVKKVSIDFENENTPDCISRRWMSRAVMSLKTVYPAM